MQQHTLIAICIGILTATTVTARATEATGIGPLRFLLGAALALCLSPFNFYGGGWACNAACVGWPLFWLFTSWAQSGRLRPYAWGALLPGAAVVLYALVRAWWTMYYAAQLDTRVLCASMLLWAAGVGAETLQYTAKNTVR